MTPIKNQAGFIGALIGGALSVFGGERRNKSQEGMSAKQMAFQSDQADIARAYNERMSSTAVQRNVKDMRQAGLNPILAAGQGASSPSSPSPAGAMPVLMDTITPAVNTAMQVSRTEAEVDQVVQNTKKLTNETISAWYNKEGAKWQAVKAQWDTIIAEVGIEQAEVLLDTAQQELKLAARRGEIAETEAGKIFAWIREFMQSLTGSGRN